MSLGSLCYIFIITYTQCVYNSKSQVYKTQKMCHVFIVQEVITSIKLRETEVCTSWLSELIWMNRILNLMNLFLKSDIYVYTYTCLWISLFLSLFL